MPGDKSISHRLAMIGSIAEGTTTIENFAASADSHSTLACLHSLGIPFDETGTTVTVEGKGLGGYLQPETTLNAENSGTTARMLSGILAGNPIDVTIVGDASLSVRPMKRIIEPLRRFGARFEAREDNFLPLTIHGGPLQAIEYQLPVASAQVKSAVLFAGLHANGKTRVVEPSQTRNHTEIALKLFGAKLDGSGRVIEITGRQRLSGRRVRVPGDVSSAAFFVAAALGIAKSQLRIRDVGLNPTRTGFINLLEDMGARIAIEGLRDEGGEPVGNLLVEGSDLAGGEVHGNWIANVIDEIPVLAILGTRMRYGIRVQDAAELRAKESDRIHTIVQNLRAVGVQVEEFADGLFVPGRQKIKGGTIDSHGDHRIAMAFAVAALFAEAPIHIENASSVNVSFPGFFDVLKSVCGS